ncbi:GIY-YIG nuclease family protein [Bradyrhizobium sp. 139]|uniref:GIY-YIG nuclease family protein n=1 Tax=Bradyrhizobium sp. 139 TaxID=2782616 RepID=UPI001FF7DCD2|nr:GIY-YIG nuclease family protein [Bradyrhizobium sp. 139]MCK1741765.1 GIY-YIG nuclease family protein [Bradyrhizobium sp. 139]
MTIGIEKENLEFLTAIGAVREALRLSKPFYVYVLHRPDGEPFYVGKGVADRILQHESEARNTRRLTHKLNVIRALHRKGDLVHYRFDGFFDDELEALARERHLIQKIGRHDLKLGPLTNQTDGGEGTSNPSEESRQKRRESLWGDDAQDPERQIANSYFRKLASVQSVTLKPANTFRRAAALRRNRASFPKSPRQAATLVASAIENRVMLCAGALIPRRLAVDGAELIIENGVGCDMLSSEMIELTDGTPTREILRLTPSGFNYIVQELGADFLIDAGILLPELEKR